jgi:hypothetical protein
MENEAAEAAKTLENLMPTHRAKTYVTKFALVPPQLPRITNPRSARQTSANKLFITIDI